MDLMGVPVATNSQGFRDEENSKAEKQTVLALGGCSLFGWGIKNELRYGNLLDESLLSVNILNRGLCDFKLQDVLGLYQDRGGDWSHTQLIYFMEPSDLLVTTAGKPSLFNRSWFYALVSSRIAKMGKKKDFKNEIRDLYEGEIWEASASALKKLRELALERGAQFRVVLVPDFHRLNPYPFEEQEQKLADFLNSQNISFFNLRSLFKEENNSIQYWLAFDDPVPNRKAHEKMAAGLKDWMSGKTPR